MWAPGGHAALNACRKGIILHQRRTLSSTQNLQKLLKWKGHAGDVCVFASHHKTACWSRAGKENSCEHMTDKGLCWHRRQKQKEGRSLGGLCGLSRLELGALLLLLLERLQKILSQQHTM